MALCACLVTTVAPLPGSDANAARPNRSATARLWQKRGDRAYQEQRYDDAVAAFKAAFDARPEPESLWMLARSYQAAGRDESARETFARFVAHPKAPPKLVAQARTLLASLDTRIADARLGERLKQAKAFLESGLHRAAALAFDEAMKLRDRVDILWSSAQAWHEAGDIPKARLRLDRLLTHRDIDKATEIAARDLLASFDAKPEPGAGVEPGKIAIKVTTEPPSAWSWVSLAAGAAFVGAGIGLHFYAEGLRDDVRAPSAQTASGTITSPSQVSARALEDEANLWDSVGVAAMVVGAVGMITGTVLAFTTGGDPIPPLEVKAGRGGVVVTTGARF